MITERPSRGPCLTRGPARLSAFYLVALIVILNITYTSSAPVSTEVAIQDSEKGCYYMMQHYDEGQRIVTNEPCLNCTCHDNMLMCFLKVCPFAKPIGQDCIVEKRPDQCCPVITCPEVPVPLMIGVVSTTHRPVTPSFTGLAMSDEEGCLIEEKYYPDGAQVPSDPNKPCDLCYCIRNHTACVMQECILHVDGCSPIFEEEVCCPVRYECDRDKRPMIIGTTAPPAISNKDICFRNGEAYADGALVPTDDACEHCYCMHGDIVCAVQECGRPMQPLGDNCVPVTPPVGQCCPEAYECTNGSDGTPLVVTDSTVAGSDKIDNFTPSLTVEEVISEKPALALESQVSQSPDQISNAEKTDAPENSGATEETSRKPALEVEATVPQVTESTSANENTDAPTNPDLAPVSNEKPSLVSQKPESTIDSTDASAGSELASSEKPSSESGSQLSETAESELTDKTDVPATPATVDSTDASAGSEVASSEKPNPESGSQVSEIAESEPTDKTDVPATAEEGISTENPESGSHVSQVLESESSDKKDTPAALEEGVSSEKPVSETNQISEVPESASSVDKTESPTDGVKPSVELVSQSPDGLGEDKTDTPIEPEIASEKPSAGIDEAATISGGIASEVVSQAPDSELDSDKTDVPEYEEPAVELELVTGSQVSEAPFGENTDVLAAGLEVVSSEKPGVSRPMDSNTDKPVESEGPDGIQEQKPADTSKVDEKPTGVEEVSTVDVNLSNSEEANKESEKPINPEEKPLDIAEQSTDAKPVDAPGLLLPTEPLPTEVPEQSTDSTPVDNGGAAGSQEGSFSAEVPEQSTDSTPVDNGGTTGSQEGSFPAEVPEQSTDSTAVDNAEVEGSQEGSSPAEVAEHSTDSTPVNNGGAAGSQEGALNAQVPGLQESESSTDDISGISEGSPTATEITDNPQEIPSSESQVKPEPDATANLQETIPVEPEINFTGEGSETASAGSAPIVESEILKPDTPSSPEGSAVPVGSPENPALPDERPDSPISSTDFPETAANGGPDSVSESETLKPEEQSVPAGSSIPIGSPEQQTIPEERPENSMSSTDVPESSSNGGSNSVPESETSKPEAPSTAPGSPIPVESPEQQTTPELIPDIYVSSTNFPELLLEVNTDKLELVPAVPDNVSSVGEGDLRPLELELVPEPLAPFTDLPDNSDLGSATETSEAIGEIETVTAMGLLVPEDLPTETLVESAHIDPVAVTESSVSIPEIEGSQRPSVVPQEPEESTELSEIAESPGFATGYPDKQDTVTSAKPEIVQINSQAPAGGSVEGGDIGSSTEQAGASGVVVPVVTQKPVAASPSTEIEGSGEIAEETDVTGSNPSEDIEEQTEMSVSGDNSQNSGLPTAVNLVSEGEGFGSSDIPTEAEKPATSTETSSEAKPENIHLINPTPVQPEESTNKVDEGIAMETTDFPTPVDVAPQETGADVQSPVVPSDGSSSGVLSQGGDESATETIDEEGAEPGESVGDAAFAGSVTDIPSLETEDTTDSQAGPVSGSVTGILIPDEASQQNEGDNKSEVKPADGPVNPSGQVTDEISTTEESEPEYLVIGSLSEVTGLPAVGIEDATDKVITADLTSILVSPSVLPAVPTDLNELDGPLPDKNETQSQGAEETTDRLDVLPLSDKPTIDASNNLSADPEKDKVETGASGSQEGSSEQQPDITAFPAESTDSPAQSENGSLISGNQDVTTKPETGVAGSEGDQSSSIPLSSATQPPAVLPDTTAITSVDSQQAIGNPNVLVEETTDVVPAVMSEDATALPDSKPDSALPEESTDIPAVSPVRPEAGLVNQPDSSEASKPDSSLPEDATETPKEESPAEPSGEVAGPAEVNNALNPDLPTNSDSTDKTVEDETEAQTIPTVIHVFPEISETGEAVASGPTNISGDQLEGGDGSSSAGPAPESTDRPDDSDVAEATDLTVPEVPSETTKRPVVEATVVEEESPVTSEPGSEPIETTKRPESQATAVEGDAPVTPSAGIVLLPETIPGSCLVDGATYADGESVPSSSACTSHCICHSSVVTCAVPFCASPPVDANCSPIMREGECCPQFVCPVPGEKPDFVSTGPINAPDSDSHLGANPDTAGPATDDAIIFPEDPEEGADKGDAISDIIIFPGPPSFPAELPPATPEVAPAPSASPAPEDQGSNASTPEVVLAPESASEQKPEDQGSNAGVTNVETEPGAAEELAPSMEESEFNMKPIDAMEQVNDNKPGAVEEAAPSTEETGLMSDTKPVDAMEPAGAATQTGSETSNDNQVPNQAGDALNTDSATEQNLVESEIQQVDATEQTVAIAGDNNGAVEPENVEELIPVEEIEIATDSAAPLEPVTDSAAPLEPVTPSAAPFEPVTDSAAPLEPVTDSAAPLEPVTDSAAPLEPVTPSAAPFELVTDSAAPFEPVPDSVAPLEPVTDSAAPLEPVPDSAAPLEPVPDSAAPLEPVPDSAAPIEPVPDSAAPLEPATDSAAPIEPVTDLIPVDATPQEETETRPFSVEDNTPSNEQVIPVKPDALDGSNGSGASEDTVVPEENSAVKPATKPEEASQVKPLDGAEEIKTEAGVEAVKPVDAAEILKPIDGAEADKVAEAEDKVDAISAPTQSESKPAEAAPVEPEAAPVEPEAPAVTPSEVIDAQQGETAPEAGQEKPAETVSVQPEAVQPSEETIAVEPQENQEKPAETVSVQPEAVQPGEETIAVELQGNQEKPAETVSVQPEAVQPGEETIAVAPQENQEKPAETVSVQPEAVQPSEETIAVEPQENQEKPAEPKPEIVPASEEPVQVVSLAPDSEQAAAENQVKPEEPAASVETDLAAQQPTEGVSVAPEQLAGETVNKPAEAKPEETVVSAKPGSEEPNQGVSVAPDSDSLVGENSVKPSPNPEEPVSASQEPAQEVPVAPGSEQGAGETEGKPTEPKPEEPAVAVEPEVVPQEPSQVISVAPATVPEGAGEEVAVPVAPEGAAESVPEQIQSENQVVSKPEEQALPETVAPVDAPETEGTDSESMKPEGPPAETAPETPEDGEVETPGAPFSTGGLPEEAAPEELGADNQVVSNPEEQALPETAAPVDASGATETAGFESAKPAETVAETAPQAPEDGDLKAPEQLIPVEPAVPATQEVIEPEVIQPEEISVVEPLAPIVEPFNPVAEQIYVPVPESPTDLALPEEEESPEIIIGPGACLFDGKVFVSAQQIPRDDPCDFCFCFRGDIICLQQSCPPPIPGCFEEVIGGFCCPRYECPVRQASQNITIQPTMPTLPMLLSGNRPVLLPATQIEVQGCEILGEFFRQGSVIPAASGPCLECRCGMSGMMECDPRDCQPEPMLRKMMAAAVKRRRRSLGRNSKKVHHFQLSGDRLVMQ